MEKSAAFRSSLFIVLSYFIFSGSSCFKGQNNEPEITCGLETTWTHTFLPGKHSYTTLDGIYREFRFEDSNTPDNICPDEHIDVSYDLQLKFLTDIDDSVTVQGNVSWGGLFGRKTLLSSYYDPDQEHHGYYGKENVGLKQVFGDKPGWVGLQFIIRFPTRGDIKLDESFLFDYMSKGIITCTYRLPI